LGANHPKHSKKEIEEALCFAEDQGWLVEKSMGGNAHCWGIIYCPHKETGLKMSVSGTPRSPENEAKRILKRVLTCKNTHGKPGENGDT